MNENDTPRAEDVLPGGYRPHVIDLAARTSTDDEPMIVAQGDLRNTAEALGSMELLTAIVRQSVPVGSPVAEELGRIEGMARFWQRHVRLIGGLAAVVVLSVVGVMMPAGAPAAQAAEGPQPDPTVAAADISITLTASTVAAGVPVTTTTTNRRGKHCASVWGSTTEALPLGPGVLGRACSRRSSFVVPVTFVSREVPPGQSILAVTDDMNPFGDAARVTLTARRPSRFGKGTWIPMPQGQVYFSAALLAYTPAKGAWTPQQASPVQIQELTRRGWRVRATLTTDPYGIATGVLYLGGGAHIVRAVRPVGLTVTATVGAAHTLVLPAEVPIDVN